MADPSPSIGSPTAGIPALAEAIRQLHGVEARHVKTSHVHQKRKGETAWSGYVEVFDLVGHPTATKAYAWSEATEGGERRFFAVLHVGPIDSATKAVQASILADARASAG
jgi:hypothetical protein